MATDGSVAGPLSSAGTFIPQLVIQLSLRLPDYTLGYGREVIAAVLGLRSLPPYYYKVLIISDFLAMVSALGLAFKHHYLKSRVSHFAFCHRCENFKDLRTCCNVIQWYGGQPGCFSCTPISPILIALVRTSQFQSAHSNTSGLWPPKAPRLLERCFRRAEEVFFSSFRCNVNMR